MRLLELQWGLVSGTGLDMHDGYVGTQTETADLIEVEIDLSGANAFCMFNADGVSAGLSLYDNDLLETYYDEEVDLVKHNARGWYAWRWKPIYKGRDIIWYFEDREDVTGTFSVAYPGSVAKVGMGVPAIAYEMGTTLERLKLAISDWSYVKETPQGETYHAQGKWAKKARGKISFTRDLHDTNFRRIVNNLSTPVAIDLNNYPNNPIGTDHTSALGLQAGVMFGWIKKMEASQDGGEEDEGVFDARGLT